MEPCRRVVVILAHEGVAQPDVWAHWLQEAAGGVQAFLHAPKDAPSAPGVERLSAPYGRTAWGEWSVLRETRAALVAVLERVEGPFLGVLASGACVPVAPPSRLLRMPYAAAFGRVDDQGRAAQQWFAFTREDAETLVARLGDLAFVDAELRRGALEGEFVPDAYLPGRILSAAPRGAPVTADYGLSAREYYSAPVETWRAACWATGRGVVWNRRWSSPLEWGAGGARTASAEVSRHLGQRPEGWTFAEVALRTRLQRPSVLFLRKVAADAVIDNSLVDALHCESPDRAEALLAFAEALPRGPASDASERLLQAVRADRVRQSRRGFSAPVTVAFLGAAARCGPLWALLQRSGYAVQQTMRALTAACVLACAFLPAALLLVRGASLAACLAPPLVAGVLALHAGGEVRLSVAVPAEEEDEKNV
jgi:hypothetical protein